MNTLVGEVFIVMIDKEVQDVFSNQYLADEVVDTINRAAKEKHLPYRAYVIVRNLYSF